MKQRIKFNSVLTCAALLLAACNFDGNVPEPPQKGFLASQEIQTSESRTMLDNNSVLWSAEDTITVFKVSLIADGYAGCNIGIDPADDGKVSGHFYNEACEDYYDSECYAVYPASSCLGAEGTNIKINLPAVQNGRIGSFGINASPAVAISTKSRQLNFRNLCGLLAVTVENAANLSEIKLTTLSEEALWGEGTVDMTSASEPVLKMAAPATDAQKTVTLRIEPSEKDGRFVTAGATITSVDGKIAGDASASSDTYYIVVPAGSFASGFTMHLKCADGSFMTKQVSSNGSVIERSMCSNIKSPVKYQDESEVVIRTDVQNKAFYKDLLMDTGIGMSDYKTMPVTSYLNLSTETFYAHNNNSINQSVQNKKFIGDKEDENGILLYPDGEPRYRMIYVNGGVATTHGRSWMVQGRENIRTFFYNGGSYVGSCAGAFVASYGVIDSYIAHNGYLGLWPGYASNTTIYDVYPDYIIPEDSPLLKYYDFGGDHRVAGVKHWNGPYFEHWDMVPGTEVLCINDYPEYKYHMLPSVIAYKPSIYSGRVIPSGGHPEQEKSGEKRDLMAAYVKYALDGVGIAKVKGILHNGEVRQMVKSTSDNDPEYTKVGDKQCHHFAVAIPDGARNIRVRLEALSNFNLSLRMANGTFAFKEDAQYAKESKDLVKELCFDTLPKGTWYIGVQCEETVSQNFGVYGIQYSGKKEVLNGVPYTISITWE